MPLSFSQKIKRQLALLGGSYTHPDGYIELDFDAAARITRGDSTAEQFEKIDALARREASRARFLQRVMGAAFLGWGIYSLGGQLHVAYPFGPAVALGFGVFCLAR